MQHIYEITIFDIYNRVFSYISTNAAALSVRSKFKKISIFLIFFQYFISVTHVHTNTHRHSNRLKKSSTHKDLGTQKSSFILWKHQWTSFSVHCLLSNKPDFIVPVEDFEGRIIASSVKKAFVVDGRRG